MDKRGQIGNLYNYVLVFVLVAMVIGLGIVILDKFGDQLRQDTKVNAENVTSNGTSTLSNTPVREVGAVINSTGNVSYTSSGDTVTITNGASWFLVNYTYGADTASSDGVFSSIDAITPIASDWMPIIVIVAVLGIVLSLVLGAFGAYGKRQ